MSAMNFSDFSQRLAMLAHYLGMAAEQRGGRMECAHEMYKYIAEEYEKQGCVQRQARRRALKVWSWWEGRQDPHFKDVGWDYLLRFFVKMFREKKNRDITKEQFASLLRRRNIDEFREGLGLAPRSVQIETLFARQYLSHIEQHLIDYTRLIEQLSGYWFLYRLRSGGDNDVLRETVYLSSADNRNVGYCQLYESNPAGEMSVTFKGTLYPILGRNHLLAIVGSGGEQPDTFNCRALFVDTNSTGPEVYGAIQVGFSDAEKYPAAGRAVLTRASSEDIAPTSYKPGHPIYEKYYPVVSSEWNLVRRHGERRDNALMISTMSVQSDLADYEDDRSEGG